MRFILCSTAMLALTACSGSKSEPAPAETSDTVAVAGAVAATSGDANEPAPSPETTATPEPAASMTPVPKVTATPEPKPNGPSPAAPKSPPPPPAAPVEVAMAKVPGGFARCAVCHNATKGAPDKLGPNLWGVFGSAAGQGSFAYSEALKGSGLKWDDATMNQWLENPRALVPGNRMSFPGLKDAAKRQEIIDYLKQQR